MQISVHEVVQALHEKSKNPTSPHRIWLLGGGGSLNGAYLAGVQVALVEAGLHHVFDGVIGVSTSIPALGYMAAAQSGEKDRHFFETTTYSVEARSRNFLKWYGKIDIPWLVSVFKGATGKPIRYERVQTSGLRFVGVATDWKTGAPQYIEPTNEDEFYRLIAAGCSIPFATPPVLLRDEYMTDGGASDPCPISWLMSLPAHEQPTHVLIVTNAWCRQPGVWRQRFEWKVLQFLFGRKVPKHILNGFAMRYRRFHHLVEMACSRHDVSVAVDWLPWPQSPLERNQKKIAALTQVGYERFKALIQDGSV